MTLLAVGAFGVAAAVYSAIQVVRGIRAGSWLMRLLGVLSVCCGILVGLIGSFYALEAVASLPYYLRGLFSH